MIAAKRQRIRSQARLRGELLESRELLAADFGAMDINTDGKVDFQDAILAIQNHDSGHIQFDVNGDGMVGPVDSLAIVNQLNDPGGTSPGSDDGVQESMIVDDHVNEIGPDATMIDLALTDGALIGRDTGNFEIAGDVDVFQFEVQDSDTFRLDFVSFNLHEIEVTLVDSEMSVLGTAASSDLPFFQSLEGELSEGTYFVVATSVDSAVGGYNLGIQLGEFDPPTVEDDHVDTPGIDATVVELSDSGFGFLAGESNGLMDFAGDIDVFQFNVTEEAAFELFFTPSLEKAMQIDLIDSDGITLAEWESVPYVGPYIFDADLDAGDYYLAVHASDGVSTGYYTFDIQLEEPEPPAGDDHVDVIGDDATDINLSPNGTTLVGIGLGEIGTPGDTDVFQFDVERNSSINITYLGLPSESLVEVLDTSGTVVAAFTSARFSQTTSSVNLTSGTYYISVAAASDSVGGYFFELEIEPNASVLSKISHFNRAVLA